MRFNISDGALHILETLNAAGYEAYLVGGCVRDLLRGVLPRDWDICTSALPMQTKACFPGCRIIETGLKHGTVTILWDGNSFEVTTYRTDGTYSDGRRPDGVQFVRDLREDLSRRDFTINAIAMDAGGALQDPFSGAEDIRRKIVRCVGEPDQRFREDGLRIMRALRFASSLGFSIREGTGESICRNKGMLSYVAAERINVELCKLLTGVEPRMVLEKYGCVLCEFWPELGGMIGKEQHNPQHCHDIWQHTIAAVESAPRERVLRLTMLLHDIGKPRRFTLDDKGAGHLYGHPAVSAKLAGQMLRRLKFDNDTRKQVVELIAHHDARLEPQSKLIRRWLNKLGEERFYQLLEVKRADYMGRRKEPAQGRLDELREIKEIADGILSERQCFALRDLAVDGRDVIKAGAEPGPAVGAVLHFLMDRVLEEELPNEREALRKEAARYIKAEAGEPPDA